MADQPEPKVAGVDPVKWATMPRMELRQRPHDSEKNPDGTPVIMYELWWHGELVGALYPSKGPGIRILSKHPTVISPMPGMGLGVSLAVPKLIEFADAETQAEHAQLDARQKEAERINDKVKKSRLN